jgi:hypothetical protein
LNELNPEYNNLWHRAKLTGIEWLAVIIAGLSVFIAITAHYEAVKANIRSELLNQNYKELEREYRLAQLAIDDFKIAMIRSGIELEHDGEKP